MKLELGDCLKLIPGLPKHSIDMILADLPYGQTKAKWDSIIPLDQLWKQYRRVIKDHGVIILFGNEPFSSAVRMSNPHMYRYDWKWIKTMPTGFLNAHRQPLHRYEDIMVFYKHLPTYNPQMVTGKEHHRGPQSRNKRTLDNNGRSVSNAYGGNFVRKDHKATNKYFPSNIIKFSNAIPKKHRYHPTQKPVKLLKYLIKTYTNRGDTVLDNVMGSGSTGIACKETHRKFIGMEINKKYYEIAKKRINTPLINHTMKQESLF